MDRQSFGRFLYRHSTRRWLIRAGSAALALLVALELLVHLHAYFSIADFLGFNALFGFGSCVLMVVFAKALGFVLKRREDYYDDE